jgi:flagellar L-ring protein precursor FlgH
MKTCAKTIIKSGQFNYELFTKIKFIIPTCLMLGACSVPTPRIYTNPSADYASRVKRDYANSNADYRASMRANPAIGARGQNYHPDPHFRNVADTQIALVENESGMISNLHGANGDNAQFGNNNSGFSEDMGQNLIRDYNGPLSLGEPGVGSSLWRESKSLDLIRDVRAFQPMDLITIMVEETTEGKREADTDIKQESSLSASISSLFGIDDTIIKSNPQITNGGDNLVDMAKADFNSEFKGEGETTRKGSLKGRISAMVVEVLPSGILRIEGEKIVAVNNEDEVMVISGLVRPEDVTSANEVRSSKVANMRIDYFGQGTVGDAQNGGWFGRIIRRFWPI